MGPAGLTGPRLWYRPAHDGNAADAVLRVALDDAVTVGYVDQHVALAVEEADHLECLTNLSDDREQQYFADGITTDLSRMADMVVISRNTGFTYQDKRVDTKQIGRELGVRYVLEGSVRRSGNQVRVNAQLIDAETNAHLWAERFDRDVGDLFALQNEITSRIARALNVSKCWPRRRRDLPTIPTRWTTFPRDVRQI